MSLFVYILSFSVFRPSLIAFISHFRPPLAVVVAAGRVRFVSRNEAEMGQKGRTACCTYYRFTGVKSVFLFTST
jgi:hypothetical protein